MRALKPHLMSIHRDPPLTTEQRVLLRRRLMTLLWRAITVVALGLEAYALH